MSKIKVLPIYNAFSCTLPLISNYRDDKPFFKNQSWFIFVRMSLLKGAMLRFHTVEKNINGWDHLTLMPFYF